MATLTLTAATPGLPLNAGSILRLEAISPTTGAAITGVVVTNVAVYGYDVSTELGPLETDVVPLLTPEEIDLG